MWPNRCPLMVDDGCQLWWDAPVVPVSPPPLGTRECPGNCNGGMGICNRDTGTCNWPAGAARPGAGTFPSGSLYKHL